MSLFSQCRYILRHLSVVCWLFCLLNSVQAKTTLDFVQQRLCPDEITLAECLQGLVNRSGPNVYFTTYDYNAPNPKISYIWLNYLTNQLGMQFTNSANFRALIQEARDSGAIAGLVRYNSTNIGGSEVQNAITLSAQLNALPVTDEILNYESPGLLNQGTNLCFAGLPVLADIRGRWSTRFDAQKWAVTNLLTASSTNEVFCDGGHFFGPVTGTRHGESGFCGRDYAVKLNAFCFDFPFSHAAYSSLFSNIMDHLTRPAPLLGVWPGYVGGESEGSATPVISAAGNYWVLTHHVMNLSFLSGIPVATNYLYLRRNSSHLKLDKSKYYVLFQGSEGDTIKQAYDMPGSTPWNDPKRGTIPVGWGINPQLCSRFPIYFQFLNTYAGPKDSFFSGPGGAGYVWLKFMSPLGQTALGAASEPYLETTGLQLVDMWGLDVPSLVNYSSGASAVQAFTGEIGPTNMLLPNGIPLTRCSKELWYGSESMTNSTGRADYHQIVGRIKALAASNSPPYFIPVYDTVNATMPLAEICATNLGPQFVIVGVEDYINLQQQFFDPSKNENKLATTVAPVEPAIILTPAASPKPRINGATIFGIRPGSPFLYTIAATGDRPMTFSASGLPDGLQLDSQTGRITGSLNQPGVYVVTLHAKNALGLAKRKFNIVVGDKIALTPPMGWNSWNCFASAVSEDKVKAAADAMVQSGLINHGWTYINVDDFWQNSHNSDDPTLHGPFRDVHGNIVPNSRFPDMKGMADYIHDLGLKAGLYSSPGPWTCGGCAASWRHEAQDAAQYAAWGFDYLKYDWCSYDDIANGKDTNATDIPTWPGTKGANDQLVASYPYEFMGNLLRQQNRDIVFSLCQYGMEDVWKWGASVQGNSWRTTWDINDNWSSMSGIGFNQDSAAPYAGPGHWNDPDMLVVGKVGWGNLHPTHLTPNEQYTHISLWCLLSAPLLIGCDMTQLDPFTLNLLENDEVLAVDQDPLGKEAITVAKTDDTRVYAKDLVDGSKAVGLFNLGTTETQVQVNWSDLGLNGKRHVRDLWRQQNLGRFRDSYTVTVPRHGVVLIRVW